MPTLGQRCHSIIWEVQQAYGVFGPHGSRPKCEVGIQVENSIDPARRLSASVFVSDTGRKKQGIFGQFLVTVKGLGETTVSKLEETYSLLKLPGWLHVFGQIERTPVNNL